ncbi:MAG TPA: energy transducer TonB, partial [Kofleriaceae bacterium]|nr:energy transducer TonB [Kofleriaceae bacterium]
TEDLLERAVGGGSVDHIEDAEGGDFTALNSRKWKYATFFNRMKRQVAQNWHPDQVYIRRDPTGNIYGTRDRLTILSVSLKPNGSVAKIYVAKQSGVDFLDDEAVRAFREAQPFPNPPGGLVDARSNLITFSFGFHFGIGGDRSRWKVFRYQDQ